MKWLRNLSVHSLHQDILNRVAWTHKTKYTREFRDRTNASKVKSGVYRLLERVPGYLKALNCKREHWDTIREWTDAGIVRKRLMEVLNEQEYRVNKMRIRLNNVLDLDLQDLPKVLRTGSTYDEEGFEYNNLCDKITEVD